MAFSTVTLQPRCVASACYQTRHIPKSGLPAPCAILQHLIRALGRFKTVSWEFLSTDLLLNISTIALAGWSGHARVIFRSNAIATVVVYQNLTQFFFPCESISKITANQRNRGEARPQNRPPIGKQSATTTKAVAFRWNARCQSSHKLYPLAKLSKLSKQSVPCHKQCEWTEWCSFAIQVQVRAFNPKAFVFNNTMGKNKKSIVYTT